MNPPCPRTPSLALAAALAGALALGAVVARAQTSVLAAADAGWPDLADLGHIEVTIATRRATPLEETAAAVTVLTGDEIHRHGADSIPQALRGVPGLNVSQINGSAWGIGARGFANQFSAKLLVMIDGRSVYTPVFGGVFWDSQDLLLEDLDRIEVALGATGSLWGANAENGVINILTRSARDTQGDLASTSIDDSGRPSAALRHGWRIGTDTYARVYLKYRETPTTVLPSDEPAGDATRRLQGGFRIDGSSGRAVNWTLQGDAYRGWNDYRVTLPTLAAPPTYRITDTDGETVSGANLLGRLETTLASGGSLRWQAYVDENARSGPIFDVRVLTADLEFQHSLAPIAGHKIDWGLAARRTAIQTRDRWVSFAPTAPTYLESVFVQDQCSLVPDVLVLTAGAKFEYSNTSGFEPQPCVKLAWLPAPRHTLWVGWARAVRTPAYTELANRTDAAVLAPGVMHPTLPAALRGLGNPDLTAEHLSTIDAGWRWRPTDRFSTTLTAYLNEYTSLIKVTGATPYVQTMPYPGLIVPLPEDNGMAGRTYGGEFAGHWQASARWRFDFGCAYTRVELRATTPDPFNFVARSSIYPERSGTLATTIEPVEHWLLTAAIRYVAAIPRFQIPAYAEADLRVAWTPNAHWEVAVVGRDLLHDEHPELNPSLAGPAVEIPRSVQLKVTWRY